MTSNASDLTRSFTIEPRNKAPGWKLILNEGADEVGSGIYGPGETEYLDAMEDGFSWLGEGCHEV